ncbi:MAG: plastocyanin/azurin family copper-binding protein [Chitinophagaceae bacterium]
MIEIYRTLFYFFLQIILLTGTQAQVNADVSSIRITIKAVPGLQYDLVRFMVKPGTTVTLLLANTDDMNHNILVTQPGTRLQVVDAALQLAEKGPQMNYIPLMKQVVASIPVVSPGQQQSVTFTAPSVPGVYPYVCTYPGHGYLMFGAMYVMNEGEMPAIASDPNIPEARRVSNNATARDTVHNMQAPQHPYALTPPFLYRVFIEGASPAAIVVRLPGELSFCWDAGNCKLRFAWKGGFVEVADLWNGHADASAKILGDVFYRDNLNYPLRIGKNAELPLVKFKGYRLVDKYPEFHYTIDGIDVYELIHAKEDGNGLVRGFRIPAVTQPVWFFVNHQDDTMVYDYSTGRSEKKGLELTAVEAKNFTVTMTSYPLLFQKKKK